ncbi:MAG: PrsW family glutamic-type intramembrane protease [Actinomycetia bacterium]|nr:PrsW family glutamic-type intramembrane protease [Actinomycetes bacterium]
MSKYLPSIGALVITLSFVLVMLTSEISGGSWTGFGFLVAAVGAVISLLLFLVAFVGTDRRSMLPSLAMGGLVVPVLVVVAGVVLFFPVLLVAELAVGWIESSGFDLGRSIEPWALALLVELAVLAPVIEETLKPFASILRRPTTRREAFLFGVAAGVGFAMLENLVYAAGGGFGFDWLPIAVTRMAGVALHPFGAALISVAVFERKNIVHSYSVAIGAHMLWNGAIAVTLIAYADSGVVADGYLWGVAMFGMLTMIGTGVFVGLLSVAASVREDEPVRVLGGLDRLGQPEGVGALALVATAIAIPFAIAMFAFPRFLSL